jgi:hypothetical protein
MPGTASGRYVVVVLRMVWGLMQLLALDCSCTGCTAELLNMCCAQYSTAVKMAALTVLRVDLTSASILHVFSSYFDSAMDTSDAAADVR